MSKVDVSRVDVSDASVSENDVSDGGCECCGRDPRDTTHIYYVFPLPDNVTATADTDPLATFLRLDSGQAFSRCLLPVSLSGGSVLVFGTWMEIGAEDLVRVTAGWSDPTGGGLVLHGVLANEIGVWQEELAGAGVVAILPGTERPPLVVNSDVDVVRRILNDTWDSDRVLSWFPDQLPVPVRTRIDRHWSIERSAGLTLAVDDGTWCFAGPGRSVFVEVVVDDSRRPHGEFLDELLRDAPEVPPEQTTSVATADDITHALWLPTEVDGQPQHDFYAHVVREGTALTIGCFHTSPDDHAWAERVLRSVVFHP